MEGHVTPRELDLVSTLLELEPTDAYPARAAAAVSELLGSTGWRLVLRDGTEHRGGSDATATSVPLTIGNETIGTMHLASAVDPSEMRTVATIVARGLNYGRRISSGPTREPSRALADSPLTPRERDVVSRLVAGASTRDISQAMGLTISTVNTYMKRIFAKLGVHSRVELVAWVNGTRS